MNTRDYEQILSGRTGLSMLILLLSALWSAPALAIDYVWVGAGSYTDANNWSPNGVPGAGDQAIYGPINNANCVFDDVISVGGIRIDSGYLGTLQVARPLTIGSAGYVQYSGNFEGNYDGNSDPVDINGHFTVTSGSYETTNGQTTFAGGWRWLSSSTSFWTQSGAITFDGNLNGIFETPPSSPTPIFTDVRFEKGNTFALTLINGSDLLCYGNLDLINGTITSATPDSEIQVRGDVFVGTGYDVTGTSMRLLGPDNSTYTQDYSGRVFNRFYLDKDFVSDTVYFRSSTGNFTIGDNSDSLWVLSATLTLIDNAVHDFNCRYIELSLFNGRLNANPGATIQLQGNLKAPLADPLLTFKAFGGTVVLDGNTTQYIETDGVLDFHNLTLDKGNTFIYTLQGGARLRVNNQLTLTNGSYRHGFTSPSGENRIEVYGNLTINSGYDLGNGRLQMRGSGNAIVDRNKGGRGLENFIVNKASSNDTVFVYATGAHGANADTLNIWEGTIYWPDSADVDLDFGETYVQPGGTLVNSKNVIRSSGNVSYTGGQYQANNGTWLVDGSTSRTFSSPSTVDFYNLTLNKGNTFIWTIAPGQVHNVLNKATFDNGSYHSNSNTFLDFYKDCEVNAGYDVGTGRVRFVGSTNGSFIHDKTGRTFRRILINKSGAASVTMTKSSGSVSAGINGDTLEVLTGVLNFGTSIADLDYSEVLIQSTGTMVAPSGNALVSGNFRNLGGSFQHNSGNWTWNGATERTYESLNATEFWDWTLDKSNTFRHFINGGDTAAVLNHATFTNGALVSLNYLSIIAAYGDVTVGGGYDTNNGRVVMLGDSNTTYNYNKSGRHFFVFHVKKNGDASVSVNAGSTPTMGTTSDTMRIESGRLEFDVLNADMDYLRIDIMPEGTLQAPAGTAFCQSDFSNLGSFEHNMGEWQWNGATERTYSSAIPTDFWDFTLNKSNTFRQFIAAGDTANVWGTATFTDGGLRSNNYDGIVAAYGNVTVNGGYDPSNGRVVMLGDSNVTYQHNKSGRHFYVFDVQKGTDATVTVNSGSTPIMGLSSDSMRIWSGRVEFATTDANLDYRRIDIFPAGTLQAPAGTAFCSSDFINDGSFEHNSGTWTWDGATERTYVSPSPTDFWNWTLNKSSTFKLFIAAGDTANVLGHASFNDGALRSNNYDGIVAAYGNITVNGGYDVNNGRVIMMGDQDVIYNHNKTGQNFWVFDVRKDVGSKVTVTTSFGTPLMGIFSDTMRILSGTVDFLGTTANIDYGELELEDEGTLVAASSSTTFQGNFRHLGGSFDHNNAIWSWDGATNTRFESEGIVPFYNTTLTKSNTFTLTVDAADTLQTMELLTLNDGRFVGTIEALGNVQVNGGTDGIVGELRFAGVDTQSYAGSLSLINSLYVIDKSAGEVQLGSIMYIDGVGQVLDLRRGVIRGNDANYVHFTDAGSWINASDLSYIAGPVYHFGIANFSFPVGDENRYAPARLEALTSFNTMKVRYYAESADPLYPLSSTGPGIDHVGSTQYWTVERTGGFSNVRLLLDSVAAWESGVDDPSSLVLTRWAPDSMYWDTEGRGGYENGFVSLAGTPGTLDGFGPVTFASDNGNNPLDGVSPVCLKPQTLNATPGPLSALLDWSVTADAIGYFFEGENLGGPGSVALNLSTNSLPANSLDPCNPYRYRVTAVCADTTSPVSDWLDFSTTGCDSCGIPDSLRVTGITSTTATLEWNPVPSTLAYGILGGPSSGGTAFLTTTQTFQNVGGLTPSTDYEWQVAAWCGADTSDFSALVFFSTPSSRSADPGLQPQFRVFPNPVSDVLYVQGSVEAGETWTVVLRDLQGRIAMVRNSADTETLMLDVSELPAGAYTAELVTESNRHEARLLIQH